MKRRLNLYLGIAIIALRFWAKRKMRELGQHLKTLGKRLELWGEDDALRWSIPLFHSCYLIDIELRTRHGIYRGPMYAAYLSGKEICFKLNWVAKETLLGWKAEGARDFICSGFSAPRRLENGDIWFTYDGGHAILFLGLPRNKLPFMGDEKTPRIYTYF